MSKIWENKDGYAEQYGCVTVLYILSILAHAYTIMISCGVGVPIYVRDVVGSLNDTEKSSLLMLIKTLKLPDVASYYLHM